MRRCHCALEQTKHFEENGEQKKKLASFPIFHLQLPTILEEFLEESIKFILMKCFFISFFIYLCFSALPQIFAAAEPLVDG